MNNGGRQSAFLARFLSAVQRPHCLAWIGVAAVVIGCMAGPAQASRTEPRKIGEREFELHSSAAETGIDPLEIKKLEVGAKKGQRSVCPALGVFAPMPNAKYIEFVSIRQKGGPGSAVFTDRLWVQLNAKNTPTMAYYCDSMDEHARGQLHDLAMLRDLSGRQEFHGRLVFLSQHGPFEITATIKPFAVP